MSRTLFWYVFRDLLRIFLMASGALAAIMSFGGLLRPLTQAGLDGSQVLLVLRYSMPAMSTYSLPVAALFATTVTYGRMSADNELTACRASGISFWSMSLPAMLLGLLVSLGSLFLLCFTVPAATMKIEQVIVSNLAQVIEHQINQTHELHFDNLDAGNINIFAESAYLPPLDPKHPDDARVVLRGPMITSYYTPPGRDKYFQVPRQFYGAKEAVAYIHEDPTDGSATLRATLTDGIVFPRRFGSTGVKSQQGGLDTAEFGPQPIPSRLEQKAKFMSIFQLKDLQRDPFHGQAVQKVTNEFIQEDQAAAYAQRLLAQLNGPQAQCTINSGGDSFMIDRAGGTAAIAAKQPSTIVLNAASAQQPLHYVENIANHPRLSVRAQSLRLLVQAQPTDSTLQLTLDFANALVDTGDVPSAQERLTRHIELPMPADIAAFQQRTAQQYLVAGGSNSMKRDRLLFALVDLINHLQAEMHARVAFVVSCLLLVMVGTALGMMFRSGNFLTAFAVSVVPAMFSMVLIVSGQHVAQATPTHLIVNNALATAGAPLMQTLTNNPLSTGIRMIWASDVVIGITAAILMVRLQRQ